MMAKRDANLTSPDKNEVIPSGISDGIVPPVTSKVDPVLQSYVPSLKIDQVPKFFLKVERTPKKLLLFL